MKSFKKQRSESVWDAIEPSRAQGPNMKARAGTMIAIQEAVSKVASPPGRDGQTPRADSAAPQRPAARPHQQAQLRRANQYRDGGGARGARGGEGGIAPIPTSAVSPA